MQRLTMETMNSLAAKESHSPSTPHSVDIARAAGINTAKPLRMEIIFAGADIPTAERYAAFIMLKHAKKQPIK